LQQVNRFVCLVLVCVPLLAASCTGSQSGGNMGGTGGAGRGGTTGAAGSGGVTGAGGAGAIGGSAGRGGAGAAGAGATSGASGTGGTGGATGATGTGGATGAGGTPVACAAIAARDPNAFVHPGGLLKQSDMDRIRQQVAAGVEPWATAYQKLRADALASPTYAVRGNPTWTQVDRDGAVHSAEWESDANAAYLQALMWIVTQDTRHGAKAVEIFNAWKNLTVMTPGGTPALNAGLYAYKMVEAAEIIRSTYSGWAAADVLAFKNMLVYPGLSHTAVPASVSDTSGTFYWRIYNGDPGRHGNQDMIAWRAMIVMGVFLDDRIMFDRALRYFKGQTHRSDDLPYPSGPSPSGAQTDDNQYFTTYQATRQNTTPDYGFNGVLGNYVWESGQCQEASRDQQHAFFGLGITAGISDVAWNQGDGAWNLLDNRLLKGFEFMARYNVSAIATFPDQMTPWEPAGSDFIVRTDRTGRWRSKAVNPHFESDFVGISRGDFPGKRPVFEEALAHFKVRMGRPAPETLWTQRGRDVALAMSGEEPRGFSLDHPGFGGLTFQRPPLCAGDPIAGFALNGVPIFGVHVLPGTVRAADYDYFPVNGEGHTYHDLSTGNEGAPYRTDDVDVACGSEGQYVLTGLQAGEWITYTVHVPTAGNYRIDVRYSATGANGAIRVGFAGSDVTADVALASTAGAWRTTTVASSVALRAGVQALRVTIAGAANQFDLDSIVISGG
jgi:hypothetical protein